MGKTFTMDQMDWPEFVTLKYTPSHLGAEEVEVAGWRLGRQQAGMAGVGKFRRAEASSWWGRGSARPGSRCRGKNTDTLLPHHPEQPWQLSLLGGYR